MPTQETTNALNDRRMGAMENAIHQLQDDPSVPSQETTNTVTERRLEAVEASVKALRDERDKALLWGIVTLGTAVIGLVTWIFNYLVLKK